MDGWYVIFTTIATTQEKLQPTIHHHCPTISQTLNVLSYIYLPSLSCFWTMKNRLDIPQLNTSGQIIILHLHQDLPEIRGNKGISPGNKGISL